VLGLFGAISLFAALYVLFRSQRAAAALTPDDERQIRTLLAASGERDSLGYFATRRDKAVIFSPSGKGAVTYRVVAGVCLASGDPLGDTEAWGPAIEAWLEQARAYAWRPAVMGASEEGATAYTRAGLRAIELGDEAIIHVGEFTLDGRDMRPVRQAVNRVPGPGTPSASAGTPTSPPPRWPASSTSPPAGGTPRPSAVSRWRSAGSATPPTAAAFWSRRSTPTVARRRCCRSPRGAPPACHST
jgi:hypothetical protein